MTSCEYCGRKRTIVEGKKYCKKCALNMVQECIRCHKPYHSMSFFSSDKTNKRCNSCHNKYEKEKKRNKQKAMQRKEIKQESDIEDCSSDSCEDVTVQSAAPQQEVSPSVPRSTVTEKRISEENRKEHSMSDSDNNSWKETDVEEKKQEKVGKESEKTSTDGDEEDSEVGKKRKKKNTGKDIPDVVQKKKQRKASPKKSSAVKVGKKKVVESNIFHQNGMVQIGYIPIYSV